MKKRKEIVSGIYQIRNTKNGKIYIGSSINIYKRFDEHKGLLNKGTHHSSKLQRSYNLTKDKSVFVFETIEIIDDIQTLKEREQYYIDKYDAFHTGYNCSALANNPKYTTKSIKKATKKKELILLYEKFWTLFDKSAIDVGRKMLGRIESIHYSNATMRKLNHAMEWFFENYDRNIYSMKIRYSGKECCLEMCDKNKNDFAIYSFDKSIIYSEERSGFYIMNLKDKGLYNPDIHNRIIN